MGYKAGEQKEHEGTRKIKLLYFTYLVKLLQKDSEEVEIPPSVIDVASLIEWLRRRNFDHAHLFQDGSLQVTVNKQFSEPFTRIDEGDEVALIPTSPNAPVKK
jgi:molybdopterin converting factor small subunit